MFSISIRPATGKAALSEQFAQGKENPIIPVVCCLTLTLQF